MENEKKNPDHSPPLDKKADPDNARKAEDKADNAQKRD